MSTLHLINGDGDTICGATPREDGSNVTTDRALFNCDECLETLHQRISALEEDTMHNVLEYGHQVIGVFDNDDPAGYLSYSVGRCVLERPELITTGPLPPRVSQFMINEAGRLDQETPGMVEDGFSFAPDTLIQGYPVRVVEVDPEMYPLNSLWSMFGKRSNITVLQLVWPDMEGNFPDDQKYAGPPQPLHPLERNIT